MSEPSDDAVRAAARVLWGESSNHQNVHILHVAAVEPVTDPFADRGWWVEGRLWVPREWVVPE